MPTATIINDWEHGLETAIENIGGVCVGRKHYGVDTGDVSSALTTVLAAVPRGTAFDGTFTSCLMQDVRIVSWQKDRIVYRLEYSEAVGGGGSIDRTAVSSTAFHDMAQGVGSQEINFDISGTPIPRTNKIVPARQLVIVGYRSGAAYLTALTHWASIQGKRNSNSVTVPALLNVSGSSFTAVANELLAMDMRTQVVQPNLVRCEYSFAFGPSGTHAYEYRNEDSDGNPTGSVVTAQIYATTSYTASSLWG